jgi:hypothetical protein
MWLEMLTSVVESPCSFVDSSSAAKSIGMVPIGSAAVTASCVDVDLMGSSDVPAFSSAGMMELESAGSRVVWFWLDSKIAPAAKLADGSTVVMASAAEVVGLGAMISVVGPLASSVVPVSAAAKVMRLEALISVVEPVGSSLLAASAANAIGLVPVGCAVFLASVVDPMDSSVIPSSAADEVIVLEPVGSGVVWFELDSKIGSADKLSDAFVVASPSAAEMETLDIVDSGVVPLSTEDLLASSVVPLSVVDPLRLELAVSGVDSSFAVDSKIAPAAKLADGSAVDGPSAARMVGLEAVVSAVGPVSAAKPLWFEAVVSGLRPSSPAEMVELGPVCSIVVSFAVDSKIPPAARLADGSTVVTASAAEMVEMEALLSVDDSSLDPSVVSVSAAEVMGLVPVGCTPVPPSAEEMLTSSVVPSFAASRLADGSAADVAASAVDPLDSSDVASLAETMGLDIVGSMVDSFALDSEIAPAARLAGASSVVPISAVEEMGLDAVDSAGVSASTVDPLGTSDDERNVVDPAGSELVTFELDSIIVTTTKLADDSVVAWPSIDEMMALEVLVFVVEPLASSVVSVSAAEVMGLMPVGCTVDSASCVDTMTSSWIRSSAPAGMLELKSVGPAVVSFGLDSKMAPESKLADCSADESAWVVELVNSSTARLAGASSVVPVLAAEEIGLDAVVSAGVPASKVDPLGTSGVPSSAAEVIVLEPAGSGVVWFWLDSNTATAASLADGSDDVTASAAEMVEL